MLRVLSRGESGGGGGAGSKGGKRLVEREGRKKVAGQGWGHWQLRVWIYPQPVPMSPQDGVWVRGLYLEGAGWDRKNSCLVEAEPMQLVCLMPTIHFRPTESRKKSAKGGTVCPLPSLPAPSLVCILTQPPLSSTAPPPPICSCPAFPVAPGSDSFSCPFLQACIPVPAITIPTGQAAQTVHPSLLASTSALGP